MYGIFSLALIQASHVFPADVYELAVAGLYAVLFYDFGEGEHCFQPIRREYNKLVDTFLDVDGTQTERLQKKEKLSAMMSGELKERIKAETLERERTELARTKEAAAKSEARLV